MVLNSIEISGNKHDVPRVSHKIFKGLITGEYQEMNLDALVEPPAEILRLEKSLPNRSVFNRNFRTALECLTRDIEHLSSDYGPVVNNPLIRKWLRDNAGEGVSNYDLPKIVEAAVNSFDRSMEAADIAARFVKSTGDMSWMPPSWRLRNQFIEQAEDTYIDVDTEELFRVEFKTGDQPAHEAFWLLEKALEDMSCIGTYVSWRYAWPSDDEDEDPEYMWENADWIRL